MSRLVSNPKRTITWADLSIAVMPIVLGGAIYLFFRGEGISVFHLVRKLGLASLIEQARTLMRPANNYFHGWVLFSLPTGLWAFAFIYSVMIPWRGALCSTGAVVTVGAVFLVAEGTELAQAFGLIAGTYDKNDLLTNFVGLVIGGAVAYARQ